MGRYSYQGSCLRNQLHMLGRNLAYLADRITMMPSVHWVFCLVGIARIMSNFRGYFNGNYAWRAYLGTGGRGIQGQQDCTLACRLDRTARTSPTACYRLYPGRRDRKESRRASQCPCASWHSVWPVSHLPALCRNYRNTTTNSPGNGGGCVQKRKEARHQNRSRHHRTPDRRYTRPMP